MFRHARRTRPSLTFAQRLLCPAPEYSVLAGRAHYRHALRLPLDEHAVIFSPPRGGKTGWLARVILHYPGPVLSTTTKHDVFELTSGIRAQRGPVHVFNPQGIGAVPSTFRWNPLDGCQDPAVAIRRADAFANAVSQKGVEDATLLGRQSLRLPARLLPRRRARRPGPAPRRPLGFRQPPRRSRRNPLHNARCGAHLAEQLAEMRGEANKTISTVRMTMSRGLAFLADPALAACVLPEEGQSLDIPEFLREAGTLYLIAETRGEDAPVAPLFACLATEIHYIAALAGQPACPAAGSTRRC